MTKKTCTLLLCFLLTAVAAIVLHAQGGAGLYPPNLIQDCSPPSSAIFPIWEVGVTRAKQTTFSCLLSSLFTPLSRNVNTTSPLTGGGPLSTDLTLSLGTQAINTFLAGPSSGGSAAPAFRALTGNDLAAALITYAKIQNVAASRLLGNPTASPAAPTEISIGSGLSLSVGGVLSTSVVGTVTSVTCGTGLTGGTFTTSGTCALANPSASVLGGIESLAAVTSKWINQISTSGVPSATQPNFTDLAGSAACGQQPALTGAVTSSAGSCATSIASGQAATNMTLTTPTISGHTKLTGTTPTALSCVTGLCGTTGTVAAAGVDTGFELTISAGGSSLSSSGGTLSGTFGTAWVTNTPVCVTNLVSGTGIWNAAALPPQITTLSTTAFTLSFNPSLALVAGSTYKVHVVCFQR